MKVLVTGANGNLGSQIIKTNKFESIRFGREEYKNLNDSIPDDVEFIIHCAYDLKNSITDTPDEVIESNLLSTTKLLKASKKLNLKKFIFISSGSVYGQSSNSVESTPTNPLTINGITKKLNEEIIQSYCHENNIPFLILRVFNSFGGNDQFSVLSKMIKCSKENKVFTLYNEGIAERDYIHIDDIAKIVCHFLTCSTDEKIINIGSGKTVKIYEILDKIGKKLGELNINHQALDNEVEYSRANIKTLKKYYNENLIDIFDYIDKI